MKQNPFFTRKDFFIEIPDKKHPYFGCKVTVFFIQKNFFLNDFNIQKLFLPAPAEALV